MGIFSAIGSAFSSACSAIGSAVSSIGSALTSFASSIAPVLGSIIETFAPVAEAVGKFANAFLQGLGILKPDEKIEDFGERAMQAAAQGITIDKFENFEDYMEALRDFDLDEAIAEKRTPAEKIVAGLGIGTIAVEDKFNAERGSLNGMWLLPIANPEFFTPARMEGFVATGRLGSDVYRYLEGKLSGAESRTFEKTLATTTEDMPREESIVYAALDSARAEWSHLQQQINNKQGE